ncbi:4'-phosphopantetheinyl transferase superfamily protein [Bacillus mycoides]|uniref:4'-phosphopantetheinyl transferase family protein n=1 Tax=Bacillus mycoides TaxID=1405 RepID=UPI00187AC2B6|nr:4'-phosphopantetheinyl transferase superfamily protein [Bacillus mycoides]MBE7150862.1 4'-phosphopantetheinyl transferase superfamily protein [Bacillus mycoides]
MPYEVFAIKLDSSIDDVIFKTLIRLVSEEKQKKIMRFHRVEDAKRTLLADLLARYAISYKTGMKCEEINFKNNKYGKPLLVNIPNVYFNTSHSAQWIVCAISSQPIGIDIEFIEQINCEIAKQFFSEDEYVKLSRESEENKLDYFYQLWTLKESYVKAIGKGLSIPLDSFSISIDSKEIKLKASNNSTNCYFKQFEIDDNYKMAVCSFDRYYEDEVNFLEVDTFFSMKR